MGKQPFTTDGLLRLERCDKNCDKKVKYCTILTRAPVGAPANLALVVIRLWGGEGVGVGGENDHTLLT